MLRTLHSSPRLLRGLLSNALGASSGAARRAPRLGLRDPGRQRGRKLVKGDVPVAVCVEVVAEEPQLAQARKQAASCA